MRGRLPGRTQAAELLVVDQLRDGGMLTAHRTLRIAAQLVDAQLHAERIEVYHAADERLADAEDELDRFERLHAADQTRQHAEHSGFGAARCGARRRRLGEQAAVARSLVRREDRRLA